jgi:hypothetical protein
LSLIKLLDHYSELLVATGATAAKDGEARKAIPAGRLSVVLQSMHVLLAWTTACIIWQGCWHEHPEVREFSPSLHWQDLQYLVLDQAPALDALSRICLFLHRHAGRPEVYSGRLNAETATYSLADKIAAVHPRLQQIWVAEKDAASRREADRWRVVMQERSTCRRIRADIAREEAQLAHLRRKYSCTQDFTRHRARTVSDHMIHDKQYEIIKLEESLASALRPPPVVFQPLPREEVLGRRAVYFMHEPLLLRMLGRWSFEAYAILAFGAKHEKQREEIGNGREEYADYHDKCKSLYPSESGSNIAYTAEKQPSAHNVPGAHLNVEELLCPTQGIWHPQQFEPRFVYKGNSVLTGADAPPFMFQHFSLVLRYTAKLPPSEKALQWALEQPGAKHVLYDRGNRALSNQRMRPSNWLNKPAFLSFCSLRAAPLQQLRKLAVLLHDRLLPLTHPAVHRLIIQAVCHVGELEHEKETMEKVATSTETNGDSAVGRLILAWKRDANQADVLPVLAVELADLACELASAPRNRDAVMLLGPLSAFLSTLKVPGPTAEAARASLAATARAFARMAEGWAADIQTQIIEAENCTTPDRAVMAKLRVKQHELISIAIASYGVSEGSIDSDDLASLLRLRVRMHATQPLVGSESASVVSVDSYCIAVAERTMSVHVPSAHIKGDGCADRCISSDPALLIDHRGGSARVEAGT